MLFRESAQLARKPIRNIFHEIFVHSLGDLVYLGYFVESGIFGRIAEAEDFIDDTTAFNQGDQRERAIDGGLGQCDQIFEKRRRK